VKKKQLAWWLDAHRRYFARQAAREWFELDDDILTVSNAFEVVEIETSRCLGGCPRQRDGQSAHPLEDPRTRVSLRLIGLVGGSGLVGLAGAIAGSAAC
jgi:hypothetical protein